MSAGTILVVGGGIAGLSASAAFAQKGLAVDLIERNSQISDGGGVGLSVVANATRALAQIGVAQGCVAHGIGFDSQRIYNADGTLIIDLPLPKIGGPEWPGTMGMRRSSLHHCLLTAVEQAGVQIRCGTTVDDWQDGSHEVTVRFSDGTSKAYMLMVAADGIFSATRARMMPDVNPVFDEAVVWRAETPRPKGLDRTEVYVSSTNCVVGIVPLSDTTAYIYIGEETKDASYRDNDTLHHQMRALLDRFGGRVRELAATIVKAEQVSCRPVHRMIAPAPWHRGRAVIIGDAAHVHAPSLAQGAAMGIEDAIVLAEEVAGNRDDVGSALDAFNARRYPRAAAIVDGSTRLSGASSPEMVAQIRADIMKMLAEPI